MKRWLFGISILLAPALAQAQTQPGFYGGAGLSFTSAESTAVPGGSGTSTGELFGVSVVGGYLWNGGGTWNFGAELDADISLDGAMDNAFCGIGATGAYMCDLQATVRLRGIVATEVGAGTIFGALGVGAAFGDFATNPANFGPGSIYGVSVGAGFVRPIGGNASIRGEVNYDMFNNANQPIFAFPGLASEWSAVSARVMVIFPF